MWNKLKQWLHPDHITRSSIKEGFDDLPAAVCYFTPDGIIRLCNRQMFRVYRALSGRDLQSLEELHQQVWAPTHGRRVDGKNPSFVLPDGTCWLYSEQTVFGEGVRPHVECIFSEVTDLQRQRQELLRQNQELLRMNRELRRLSENVQEMTREKEILEFKTRLHDEMGYGLTAVRQCLLQRKDPAELEASLEQMNKAVQLFRKDSETPPEENEWSVFVEDAAQLGVTVALQGPMPRQHQQLLLTIARECITNAVRYAGANRLEITITPQGGGQRWQFENDGPPPRRPRHYAGRRAYRHPAPGDAGGRHHGGAGPAPLPAVCEPAKGGNDMTSVLIVEDQRMPRENMEHLVEDSGRYRRVASLSTAEMALAQCARHTVDLVLMDVCTKGSRDGIDVAAEIKARHPETKVIIITSMVEESYLKRAKAAGAESFWYKDVSPESLLEVMDRTMAGESLYPDRTPETRLGQVSSTQLTPREIEVLRLVCEGLEYEEIAAALGISSRTVKRFVSSLLEKTGYSNRTRLAIAVTKKNFILPHLEE